MAIAISEFAMEPCVGLVAFNLLEIFTCLSQLIYR